MTQACKKKSWRDSTFFGDVSVTAILCKAKKERECRRSSSDTPEQVREKVCTPASAKRQRRYVYQRRLRKRGPPPRVNPQNFQVVESAAKDINRVEYVKKNFGRHVLRFDDNGDSFICKCGRPVDLTNSNYMVNLREHFKSRSCIEGRAQRNHRQITEFFAPTKRFTPPEPGIYCRGLWNEEVRVKGKTCKTSLLGEYACQSLFYVSTKPIEVKARGCSSTTHVVDRSIFSVECAGHALDLNNRLRPSRTCLACAGLTRNPEFQRMLLEAQDERRFKTCHSLPDTYYSWKHLQVQKQQHRVLKAKLRWMIHNAERARQRKIRRRVQQAQKAMETGHLQRVLGHLRYIHEHGEQKSSAKLIEFISAFAAKGAQQARMHKGIIKRATGGKWEIVREIFSGLKIMGLPRANKLIRSTLGVGPSVQCVKGHVRNTQRKAKAHLLPTDTRARLRRAASLWKPLIKEKLDEGVILAGDIIPCTAGADATPVPALPQYSEHRNIIVGLCGLVAPDHKCTLQPPEQILNGEAGFNQIVRLIRSNEWASYVYVHILQPQVRPPPPTPPPSSHHDCIMTNPHNSG